jgi:hypothetical protein
MGDENCYVVNGWIPAVPVSTEVEAESPEEASEKGQERLEAEHGRVEVDEVVEA